MPREVSKTTLDNGIRILTRRMPSVRSVAMGVWVDVGSRDESVEENGLSHFIEHMIFKGTDRRSAYQIAKEFDTIGGQTNAFTSLETTCYHAKVMDRRLAGMVDILSDIFLHSVFDPTEMERERPVILQEIGMVEDSPDEFVHILSGSNFWGDHPLGRSILGSRENILRFDTQHIKAFFQRFYQPERIVISAAGNLDPSRFVDLVAPYFETVQRRQPLPKRTPPDSRSRIQRFQRVLEQVHICLSIEALPVTDERRYALSLMNTVLGGNMSSRLFQEIRERRGLAYSVYSFVSAYEDAGMMGVYAGVDGKSVRDTVAAIRTELLRLREQPVTPEELFNAKEYTKGSLLLASESNENQMVRMAQNEMHFGRFIPMQEVLDGVDRVEAEDLLQLARSLFRGERAALTVLGPDVPEEALQNAISF
ncbi:MAG: insulinase family protein [Desulfobacteraceae bacterium]|nr:insulinase family protein [Desulfobacteraceae bacterium]